MRLPLSPAWRARILAVGAGVGAGLAHPPFGLILGVAAYGLMMWLAETDGPRPRRSAFFRGWLAGVGYFAVGTHWITEPFLVDAANQGWMAPFALLLMSGGLALFWGLAALIYRLSGAKGPWRVLVFAGALALCEWLRGHVLTGFPWDLPGEAWRAGSAPSQVAAFVGTYGLSWITVALGACVALLWEAGRVRRAAVVAILLTLAGLYGFGALRLSGAPPTAADAPLVRIVQGNIDQKEKWKPENLDMVFSTYVALTTRPAKVRPDIVVWPEGALPAVIDDLLASGSPYATRLTDALQPGQTLMMGANRVGASPEGGVDYFNSLVVLRREAPGLRVTGFYDKHRLVPFGEFLPLGDLATRLGIRSLVHMPEDFTAGPPPAPIRPDGVPAVQPLICYEALFPGFASEAARRGGGRAAWLLNVSNDAWFGATSGPWQHLNIAAYRAIEEGLPIARATPTGVSTMIDAFGRPILGARLTLGQEGILDIRLPPALAPTVYSRFGDAGFAIMLLLSAFIPVLGRFRRAV
ncbi:apolipoprotein N-acyltransferase [Phenylobacterium sp.]|uniref:apolipoprotein N-acyltransferase n=1 Tax=Phenylobacterium sp. TaxID=1871053 RepID=UPI0027166B8D|nr:apolipoprotein N-acyltransferase [Phenylobacterium sp.]MDO8377500.1 apolipoprotein N-acyltransferase [Phenylobacterium sp.]